MAERRPKSLEESYNVQSFIYPPNLGWTKENANYVVFYINVPEKTKIKNNGDLGDVDPIAGVVGKPDGWISPSPYKRLKTAIALPIASRPTARYGADWDMTSLGPVVGWALTQPHENPELAKLSTLGATWEGVKSAGSKIGNATAAVALSALNVGAQMFGLGGEAGTKDIYSILTRTALNEHRTQLFKSMRFRSFSFEYHFYPRNKDEAQTIRNIIQTFKFHMHPETGGENLFLTYPSEFDIVFYFKNKENAGESEDGEQASTDQNLFKISTCAMTDFEVDYGGEQFYTFDDGMPTEISMRMGFMEIELLTADRIKQGF